MAKPNYQSRELYPNVGYEKRNGGTGTGIYTGETNVIRGEGIEGVYLVTFAGTRRKLVPTNKIIPVAKLDDLTQ